MKKKNITKTITRILILSYLFIFIAPRPQSVPGLNPLRIQSNELPLLISHGGGNLEFPDNTLEAFYHTLSIDPNAMLETDINITKDDVLILSHDRTLDRTTNLQFATISEVLYTDLLDDEVDFNYLNETDGANGFNQSGTLIPYRNYENQTVSPLDITYPEGITARHPSKFLVSTLEQLITLFPNHLINVEIKQTGDLGVHALEETLLLMARLDEDYHTFDRIVLATFHQEVYDRILFHKTNTYTNLKFSPEFNGVLTFYILQLLGLSVFYHEKVTVLQLPVSQLGLSLTTKSLIDTAHKHNIAVHYWTINDEETMRELIEKKVDGIMTDRPSLLKQVLDSYTVI
jgi:glycerophosphoryl diester phosphodiesterase